MSSTNTKDVVDDKVVKDISPVEISNIYNNRSMFGSFHYWIFLGDMIFFNSVWNLIQKWNSYFCMYCPLKLFSVNRITAPRCFYIIDCSIWNGIMNVTTSIYIGNLYESNRFNFWTSRFECMFTSQTSPASLHSLHFYFFLNIIMNIIEFLYSILEANSFIHEISHFLHLIFSICSIL